MANRVKVRLDQRKINPMLYRISDDAGRQAAERTRERARSNLVAAGRMDTGKLYRSIRARRSRATNITATWNVGTPLKYGIYQEYGVQGPVYPKSASVLRFKPKGSNTFVFAKSTSGFPGAHYLTDAYRALSLNDFLP